MKESNRVFLVWSVPYVFLPLWCLKAHAGVCEVAKEVEKDETAKQSKQINYTFNHHLTQAPLKDKPYVIHPQTETFKFTVTCPKCQMSVLNVKSTFLSC